MGFEDQYDGENRRGKFFFKKEINVNYLISGITLIIASISFVVTNDFDLEKRISILENDKTHFDKIIAEMKDSLIRIENKIDRMRTK